MTLNGARPAEASADPQSARMEAAWAGRRLTKTERLCRELVERRETIPQPMLAALLICLIDEAERRRGLPVPEL